jgi:DNA-binding GntR family transcriptional regulator
MGSNTSLHILVYKQLKELIITGELKPGDRLLEYEIAKQLNTSKTPIREAIRELAKEGLLVHEKRKKITVVDFSEKDVREILLLRAELEAVAVRLISGNLEAADVQELEAMIEDVKQAEEENDFARVRSIDIEKFHAYLINKAGNSRLEEMWRMLASQMMVLFQAVDFRTRKTGFASDRHARLLKLLKTGQTEKAEEFVRYHILRNMELIIKAYNNRDKG